MSRARETQQHRYRIPDRSRIVEGVIGTVHLKVILSLIDDIGVVNKSNMKI